MVPCRLETELAVGCASESGPLKLLAIESHWAMLLRVVSDQEEGGIAVSYCIISGEQINWLHPIDRCTAEVTRQCLKSVSGETLRKRAFEQRTRGACFDRAYVNPRTERGVRSEGGLNMENSQNRWP